MSARTKHEQVASSINQVRSARAAAVTAALVIDMIYLIYSTTPIRYVSMSHNGPRFIHNGYSDGHALADFAKEITLYSRARFSSVSNLVRGLDRVGFSDRVVRKNSESFCVVMTHSL